MICSYAFFYAQIIVDTDIIYAVEYNILFNASKSKYVAFHSNRQRVKAMDDCIFNIDGHFIENVRSYSHLVHIISSPLDDSEDILLFHWSG